MKLYISILSLVFIHFSTTLYSQSPPTITSFSPTSGPIGTTVTITGTNFDTTPANNIVFFGATQATVSGATATQLTVTVPTGATYQPITVLVDGLLAYSSSPFMVTFDGGGTIDASSFDAQQGYTTETGPSSVAIGDLDGDGKSDLAVVNQISNTVSVFRNTSTAVGAISYAAKQDYTTGTGPSSVAIGDLDGDGKADLAITNFTSSTVSVYRNTSIEVGTISYAAKQDYTTGSTPFSVAIGDLDGDGKSDLAVANSSSNTVSVFRNTSTEVGTISYAAKQDYTTGSSPFSVAIGDLDGDGKSDLAVTNWSSATVSVFRNISTAVGAISYAAKQDYTTGTGPSSVAIGDLDGDGKSDLAVPNYSSNNVSVYRNTSTAVGTISYAAKQDYTTGTTPELIAIGDLNGDGKSDLAITNSSSSTVSVFRNTSTAVGTISYAAKQDYTTGLTPFSVAIGDLDGDGKADLAVSNFNSATVSVFRNAIAVTDAFEGSQWVGTVSSDWDNASNWNGDVPNSTTDVLIPLTSINPIVSGTATVDNIEIQAGANVTVNSGAALAIMGKITGDGEVVIKRKTNANLGYSIIGSPITDATIEGLGADFIYDFNGTDYIVPSGTMTPGKGYFAAFDNSAPELTFTGTPNTGMMNNSVVLGGDNFNIVSNPYAAAISRSGFIAANGSGVIDGNIWLWDDGGSNVGGNRGGDYIAVNNVGMTSTVDLGDDVAGLETSTAFNGNIVSMQGFLVLATGNANISFNPTMQVTTSGGNDDANHFRTAEIQKLRMSLEGNGLYNDILIAFAEGATEGKDYGLDAEKYSGNNLMSFYSTQADKRYAIQTLPSVGAESREVRLGMEIGVSEVYTLAVQGLENMEGLKLILNDHLSGEMKTLTEGSKCSFTSSAGSFKERFSLTFTNTVLDINGLSNAPLRVFNQAADLIIQYPSESKEEICIYTLTGQLIRKELVQFSSGEAMVDTKRLTYDQLYIVRINNESVKFILNK